MSTQLSHALERIKVLEEALDDALKVAVEDQRESRMRAYNLALEKAAKVCEQQEAADHCAAAIRALKVEK